MEFNFVRCLKYLEDFVDRYSINVVQIIFIVFIVTIVIFGALVTLVESSLPNSIRQSFRYGKHSYKGATDKIISQLEVPKSWFKHFYVFALAWSLLALYLFIKIVIHQSEAPEYALRFLDFIGSGHSNRMALVDSNIALIGTILLTLQCLRRYYETNFIQIFSKKGKINLSHYFVGYLHYFGSISALLTNTAGFVRDSKPNHISLTNITLVQWCDIIIFLYAWHQQYVCNILLVNLRRDTKTGAIKTEKHISPCGGWFELLSSPHMLFEIVMYYCLADLFTPIHTWKLIFIWVASNQTINALLTHQWYKDNFKDYPKGRKAIIPYIL